MKCIGVQAVSASASGFAMAAIATSNPPDESVLRSKATPSHPGLESEEAGSDYKINDEVVLFHDED